MIMNPCSSNAIDAALRALHGERELAAIVAALEHWGLARVIAFSERADPTIRDVCALATGLPAMVKAYESLDPQLEDMVRRILETDITSRSVCRNVLNSWMFVAPAGWGKDRAKTITDAVQLKRCSAPAAMALLGPCDDAAALFDSCRGEISDVIRCWGQTNPENPSWWTHELSSSHFERIISFLKNSEAHLGKAVPWVPPEAISDIIPTARFYRNPYIVQSLFKAPPAARRAYRDILTRPGFTSSLEDLTMIAYMFHRPRTWDAIEDWLSLRPDDCSEVLVVRRWEDISDLMYRKVASRADLYETCAIFASASGMSDDIIKLHPSPNCTLRQNRITFFASIHARVWFELKDSWRVWWCSLLPRDGPKSMALAIRSLGPLPEILYHAPEITDSMVEEAFDRDGSMTMLRQAFLPFALRNLDGVAAHTIMSALPETPSDPAQFFSIAGKRATLPPTSKEHVHVLRDPSNLPVAVAMQRVADPPKSVGCNELWAGISAHEPSARSFALWVEDCVATLRTALEKQTHESILSIGDVLDGRSRNILFPDPERLAKKLADSDRIAEMRTVIDAIAALPPAQSLIARFMLVAIAANASFCREWSFFRDALVEPLAVSLQSRGDLFLALYDAMKPSLRGIVLPSHPDGQLSENLRTIARNDPLHAYRTSCADAAFLSALRKRTSGRSR